MAAALLAAIMLPLTTVKAETQISDEVFLTEAQSGTCTLASAAMMLRSRMFLSGSDEWAQITDTGIMGIAWAGSGLYYNFTIWTGAEEYITVSHNELNGISADLLKALLDDHPEGIVLHCSSPMHAILVTDYEGDTFFCADPARDFENSGKRVNIMDSYVGIHYSSLEGVLGSAFGYWYIQDYNIYSDRNLQPILISEEIPKDIM